MKNQNEVQKMFSLRYFSIRSDSKEEVSPARHGLFFYGFQHSFANQSRRAKTHEK